ncbi:hypothetical protein WAZ07_03400 [Bacillus sp. FJAT-51639]|uniref:Uncharacterized protein n=1 Tax=Bacillus bruguierae TaxID=3127667 RepID=A0ABU8FCG1_9BACI
MEFKNVNHKAEILIAKYEGKREELQERLTALDGEIRYMQSQVEDDFQRAIMEGTKPNERLKTDLNNLHHEKEQVTNMLANFDNLLQNALESMREEVLAERQQVRDDIRNQEEELADQLKQAKLVYLQLVIKYHDVVRDGQVKLYDFREIEQRLGLKPIDLRDYRLLSRKHNDYYYKGFYPLIEDNEVDKAYYDGELTYLAEQYVKASN